MPAPPVGDKAPDPAFMVDAPTMLPDRPDVTVLVDLLNGPERVRRATVAFNIYRGTLQEAKRDLDRLEAALSSRIAQAEVEVPDGRGGMKLKPAYANADARSAALIERMRDDPEAQRLQARLGEAERALERATVDLRYEENRLDAARAAARLLGGR